MISIKSLVTLSFFFISTLLCTSQYVNSPLVYYQFDNNYADSSGNSRDGRSYRYIEKLENRISDIEDRLIRLENSKKKNIFNFLRN